MQYIRKQETVQVLQFNGKNCMECIKFTQPNLTTEELITLSHIRSIYGLYGDFKYLLIGDDKIKTEINDYIVRSNISGISVYKPQVFNKLFYIKK